MRAIVLILVVASTSCALRPRYRDFVSASTEGKQVQLLVTDGAGVALPNVKVELSELKNRVQLTSGADGTLSLPVEKKYLDENPVLVVQVPQGQRSFVLALAPPPLPAPPPLIIEPPAVPESTQSTEPTPTLPATTPAPQGTP